MKITCNFAGLPCKITIYLVMGHSLRDCEKCVKNAEMRNNAAEIGWRIRLRRKIIFRKMNFYVIRYCKTVNAAL